MPDAATVTPQAIWSARLIRLINDQDGKPTAPDVIELAEMDPESVDDEIDAEEDAAEVDSEVVAESYEVDLWHEDDTEGEPVELTIGDADTGAVDEVPLTVDEAHTLASVYRKALKSDVWRRRLTTRAAGGDASDDRPDPSHPLAFLYVTHSTDNTVEHVEPKFVVRKVSPGGDVHFPEPYVPLVPGLLGHDIAGLDYRVDPHFLVSPFGRTSGVIKGSGPSSADVSAEDLDEVPLDVLEAAVERAKAKTRERIKRR